MSSNVVKFDDDEYQMCGGCCQIEDDLEYSEETIGLERKD